MLAVQVESKLGRTLQHGAACLAHHMTTAVSHCRSTIIRDGARLSVEGVAELQRLLALALVQLRGQGADVEAQSAGLQPQLLTRLGPAQMSREGRPGMTEGCTAAGGTGPTDAQRLCAW